MNSPAQQIKNYIRLIRFGNLMIIVITQYLVRYFLLNPIVKAAGLQLFLSDFQFFLLVLSTVMIAGAGYIINDYFDVRIDSINKPDQLIVGKEVKRRVAIVLHLIITGIAIVIGIYLALKVGKLRLALIHFMAAFILWKYSEVFKRKFLTGNVLIAFLTALVVLMPAIFEIRPLTELFNLNKDLSNALLLTVLIYAVFAFITTIIREIVKDLEDIEGDLDSYCKTVPIVLGVSKSKKIVLILLAIPFFSICYFLWIKYLRQEYIFIIYLILTVQIPFLITAYFIQKGTEKTHFKKASRYLKLLMAFGVLSILVTYLIMIKYREVLYLPFK